MKRILYPILISALLLTGCGDSFYSAQDYLTGPVDGIGLKSSTSLVSGGTEQLYPVVSPPDTSNKSVIWTSSDNSIVSVDSGGVITGVATPPHGITETAVITVTTVEGGYSSQCTVTVSEKPVAITGVTISQSSMTLHEGTQGQLTATVAPADATNQNLTWTSSSSAKVTVDASGLVTAIAAGTAIVTVTTVDGSYKASCIVTSTTDPVYTVTYNSNTATGGDVPSDTNVYLTGSTVTVMDSNTLVKPPYTFTGWNTSSDGSGTTYAVGSTFQMLTSDVTLYAKWNMTAPSGLSYSTPSALYLVGQPITNNVPSVTGTVTSWSINPALPAGLTFNTGTGVISGTPTVSNNQTVYTITASNSDGSITENISITVNITAPGAPAVTAGKMNLALSWTAVTGATAYEVWYNTTNTTSGAIQQGGNISGTSYTITGLINETLYYVWLRVKIASDTSGFSPVAIGIPAGYNLRDTGPGGGLVFYIKSSYSSDGNGVWRYLEAAPADQSAGAVWSNISSPLVGTSSAIGTGRTNTASIIAQPGAASGAAFVCHNYSGGGYTDWFLPSKNELDSMYDNLYFYSVGNLNDYPNGYWSSSESHGTIALGTYWDYDLATEKSHSAKVRAIRAF